jgi:hypothetical protein
MEILIPISIAALVGLLLVLPHALPAGSDHHEEPDNE